MIFPDPIFPAGLRIPHSCYPNCGVSSRNQLILLRQFRLGELLTIDYSTLFYGLEASFDCHCGLVGCRGKILGFNYLPVRYQDYYLQKDAVKQTVLNQFIEKNGNTVPWEYEGPRYKPSILKSL